MVPSIGYIVLLAQGMSGTVHDTDMIVHDDFLFKYMKKSKWTWLYPVSFLMQDSDTMFIFTTLYSEFHDSYSCS